MQETRRAVARLGVSDIRSASKNLLLSLFVARCELEDALNLSIPVARCDPIVIPEPARNKLSAMLDDIRAVVRQIEGSQ